MFDQLKRRLVRLIFIAWGVHKPRPEPAVVRVLSYSELGRARRAKIERDANDRNA